METPLLGLKEFDKLMKPTVCNIGYIGFGRYNKLRYRKHYDVWEDMMKKCYSEENPAGCYVDKEWHNFQNFCEWSMNNYIKDFKLTHNLIFHDTKVYCKYTSVYVPLKIKHLFPTRLRVEKLPLGISLNDNGQRFRAIMRYNGRTIKIGTFDTIEEAFKNYKLNKELVIKEYAEKFKSILPEKTYNILMQYSVEITD